MTRRPRRERRRRKRGRDKMMGGEKKKEKTKTRSLAYAALRAVPLGVEQAFPVCAFPPFPQTSSQATPAFPCHRGKL